MDWLEIRHDESDAIVEATRNALHYLRTLKQGIPTPPAAVVSSAAEEAEETEDSDALDGSQGITKRELLERQVHLPPNPTAPPCHPATHATIAHLHSTTRGKNARTCWTSRRTTTRRTRRARRPRALPCRVPWAVGAEGVAGGVEAEAGAGVKAGVGACPPRRGRMVGEGRHACCGSSCAPRTVDPMWALC